MRNTIKNFILALACFAFTSLYGQETVEVEVAPYREPCDQNLNKDCLRLINLDGTEYGNYPQDAILGFKALPGYEYVIEIRPEPSEEGVAIFSFIKQISKTYIPQYDSTAPRLKGSFRVIGFNNKPLNPNATDIILNAENRIIRGTTNCNNYHFFFEQLGYNLVFSKVLSKNARCPGQPYLDQEYFAILNNVHHFRLEGTSLKLYDVSNNQLLEAFLIQ